MRHVNAAESLWCLHVVGPDDIFAMPSRDEAVRQAIALRAAIAEAVTVTGVHCEPQAIEWPFSAQAHAEDLALGEARYG